MAKLVAPGIQVQRQTTAGQEAHINHYVQLLWVVAAGGLGIALLCVAASIGLADTNSSASAALQSRGIVDLAIANVNTAQALTVEAFSAILPALTAFPSNSPTVNPTITITTTASFTPSAIASRTSISLTRTRRPGEGFFFPTSTQIFLPTQTNTSQPPSTITKTFVPTGTSSPAPTPTVKITKTPKPTRTPTPTPLPTNIVTPMPTTEVPPPTTEVPPPTTEVPPPTTEVPPPTTEVPPPTTEVPPPTTEAPPPPTEVPPATVGTP